MKPISFVIPSRNNLSYLKWCYNSLRKNLGYRHQLLMASDSSTDGTWEWLEEISQKDMNIKIYKNENERLGIVYWYDFLCEEADNDRVMFLHADMYVCPGLDEEINKHLKKGVVVSATRIEPSLHPPGPEKILADYGIEPEEFDEKEFLRELPTMQEDKVTEGIFAPWAIMKDDYWKVGGHDKLFAPQSKEDSDIFNRFMLSGFNFKQTWKGMVYHLTSRGSRFNPMAGGAPGKDSPEWVHTTTKNMRNFIRKWGTPVLHDEYMKPIIKPKYDMGFVVRNVDENLLGILEPWCSTIYVDCSDEIVKSYVDKEQDNTTIDLSKRILPIQAPRDNDVIIEFDAQKLNASNFQYINMFPDIIQDSGEIGEMELEIFKFQIFSLKTYEKDLILVR